MLQVNIPKWTFWKEKESVWSIPHSQATATMMARTDKFYSRVLHTLLRRRGHEFCSPLERRYLRTFNELFIMKEDSFSIKRLSPLNRHSRLRQALFKMSVKIVPFLLCLVTKDESSGIIPNPQIRTKGCGHHLSTCGDMLHMVGLQQKSGFSWFLMDSSLTHLL